MNVDAVSAAEAVVILDYGSQYTQLITRRCRELSVFSEIIPGDSTLDRITKEKPKVVILSGGPNSVQVQCGFSREGGEYGKTKVVTKKSLLYGDGDEQIVWMSHGDEAGAMPAGFEVVAESDKGTVVAIENKAKRMFGLQYHPEVMHTTKGMETIRHFLFDIAGLKGDWSMQNVLNEQIAIVQSKVGPTEHVICALSGGVDSAVAATLVHKAIGDRLHCVFVDNGLLRYKEQERVMDTLRSTFTCPSRASMRRRRCSP